MKWKEFKKSVESQGITDDTDITYIDTDMYRPKAIYFIDGSYHIE
jgi:hypothetical protein